MTIQDAGIIVGILTGTLGAVLGIVNHWHHRSLTRPRMRVRPMIRTLVDRGAGPGGGIDPDVGIMEVANIGQLPVYGSTIGFHGPKRKGRGFTCVGPEAIDGGGWPRGIDPGTVVWLRFRLEGLATKVEGGEAKRGFATSAVGDVFRTSRTDMKRFRDEIAKWRRREAEQANTAADGRDTSQRPAA